MAQVTTTSSTVSTRTSTAAASNPTSLADGFYLVVYNQPNFTGPSHNYSKMGLYNIGFDADSYIWQPWDSGCCVRFCSKAKNVGYRCTSKTYQANASVPFDKVITECDGVPSPESCDEVFSYARFG